MAPLSLLSRRRLMKWGFTSASASALARMLAVPVRAQDLGPATGKRCRGRGDRRPRQRYPHRSRPAGRQHRSGRRPGALGARRRNRPVALAAEPHQSDRSGRRHHDRRGRSDPGRRASRRRCRRSPLPAVAGIGRLLRDRRQPCHQRRRYRRPRLWQRARADAWRRSGARLG